MTRQLQSDQASRRVDVAAPERGNRWTSALTDAAGDVFKSLRAELDRANMAWVHLETPATLTGETLDGEIMDINGVYLDAIIEVALDAGGNGRDGPMFTLHHEIIHALRDASWFGRPFGLFTKSEWSALRAAALDDDSLMREISIRYPDLSAEAQIEEAVAEMYAGWQAGRMQAKGFVRRAFERIGRFLEAVSNALTGNGFRTAADVFEAIDSGEIGGPAAGRAGQAGGAAPKASWATAPGVPTTAAERGLVSRALDHHPIDSLFRAPFALAGGLNERKEWKPGRKVADELTRRITAAKFTEGGRFAFANPIIEKARRGLVDRYGLDAAYVERDRQRGLDERRLLAKVPEVLASLKAAGVGTAEAKVLQAVLTGEEVGSEDMARLALPIRKAVDDMGAEAVMLGLISPEVYERNRGAYLHRVYQKDEGDTYAFGRFMGGFMQKRRQKIVGNQFKGRGLFEKVNIDKMRRHIPGYAKGEIGVPDDGTKFVMLDLIAEKAAATLGDGDPKTPKVLKRAFLPAGKPVPAEFADWTNRGTWEVRGKSGNDLTLWRDFTKDERLKMGEIVDARYTIAKTYMLMAKDLATGRFFKDIATNEEWSQKGEPDAPWKDASEYNRFWSDASIQWVRVPDTKISKSNTYRYGSLAGMFVRAEIWRDLAEMETLNKRTLWDKLLTQWKLNKTARSPVVHMNNVMSNVILMDMAGVSAGDLSRAITEMWSHGKHYRDAMEHGAFGSDMIAQEIREKTLKPILDDIAKDMQGGAGQMENSFGVAGRLADAIYSRAKGLDRKMTDLYQAEDEVFRLATYMRRIDQGIEPVQAAIEARDQIMSYDIRAPWVNAARRTVLPFISYTYRAGPIVAKTMATRPWKIAKLAMLAYAMNAMGYALAPSDDDEEEERRSMRDQEKGYTWFGSRRMMRLPTLDRYGNPMFLDVRRYIPAGDIFDTGQGVGVVDLPAWLTPGGPLMVGAELLLNRSAFTGDEIFNPLTATPRDRATAAADHLWKSWMPSAAWVPGSWYWEKIGKAASGATVAQGHPYNVPQALLSSVGVKVRPQDVETSMFWKGKDFERVERELKAESNTLLPLRQRERGLISEAAFERGMQLNLDKIETLNRKRDETFR